MQPSKFTADPGIRFDGVLRRYMDLPKLLDLLHTKSLYFRRADGFSDRLEGALFPSFRKSLDEAFAQGKVPHDSDHFYRRARLGNYVDATYCWFKHGDPVRALAAISRAAVQLKGVYDPANEFQLFGAQKHCGSCVLWIIGQLYPDEKGASSGEPQVGAPTAPAQQELIATLPPSSYPVIAVMILRIASRLGIDGPAFAELRRDADGSRMPAASFQFAGLLVEGVIAAGDFSDFGRTILRWQRALWQSMAARESGVNQMVEAEHAAPDEIKAKTKLPWALPRRGPVLPLPCSCSNCGRSVLGHLNGIEQICNHRSLQRTCCLNNATHPMVNHQAS